MLINLQPLIWEVLPRSAVQYTQHPLCLPWLNQMQTTPGCYKRASHTLTHIRIVSYNSASYMFIRETSDYWGSLILYIMASFLTFFFFLAKVALHVLCICLHMLIIVNPVISLTRVSGSNCPLNLLSLKCLIVQHIEVLKHTHHRNTHCALLKFQSIHLLI